MILTLPVWVSESSWFLTVIRRISCGFVMTDVMCIRPQHFSQTNGSTSNTRLISAARVRETLSGTGSFSQILGSVTKRALTRVPRSASVQNSRIATPFKGASLSGDQCWEYDRWSKYREQFTDLSRGRCWEDR